MTAIAILIAFAFLLPIALCAGVMWLCGSPEDRAQFFRSDE